MAGAAVLVVFVLLAVFAQLVAPYDCNVSQGIVALKNAPPSLRFPFGTDEFSRDVLSRIICGSRVSLSIALLSVVVAVSVGTTYGAIAGYLGGWADTLLMRFVDAMLAIPRVLLLVAVATLWNDLGLSGLIVLLGLTGWFGVARLVRTLVRSAREDEFVTAARALGASDARILARHIVPQVVPPVLVAATLSIGNVIVLEAGLRYLGIGMGAADASWGSLMQHATTNFDAWWVWLFAGVALIVTVLAVNLLVDGLRTVLDARRLTAR
jgi:peptide/nickel transport system permease protein